MLKKTLFTAFGLFFITSYSLAQEKDEGNIDISSLISFEDDSSLITPYSDLDRIRRKQQVNGLGPSDEIWKKVEWPNPEQNFFPSKLIIPAGDINGDGVTDFIKTFESLDERTDELYDYTLKTLIYYGKKGEINTHDDIVYYEVKPVGDLNGDGYADAVGEDLEGNFVLLVGSDEGYQVLESSSEVELAEMLNSFGASQNLRNINFRTGRDINGDEYEDINGVEFLNGEYVYYELHGNPEIVNIELSTYDFDQFESMFNFVNTIKRNDTTFFAVVDYSSYSVEFLFKRGDSLVVDTSFDLTGIDFVPTYIDISDYTGDGVKDLVFGHRHFGKHYFSRGDTILSNFFEPLTGNEETDKIFDTSDLSLVGRELLPIGDDDGDGVSRLMLVFEGFLTYFSIQHDGDQYYFNEDENFKVADFGSEGEFILGGDLFKSSIYPFSYDIEKATIFTVEDAERYFHIIVSGDSTLENIEERIVQVISHEKDGIDSDITELFFLGDLEGDGIDNFGVRTTQPKLVIYNGFNEQDTMQIKTPEGFIVEEAYGGNFLDVDSRSLMVLLRETNQQEDGETESRVNFYAISTSANLVDSILAKEISPLYTEIDMISNLGDINNDGYDDIGLTNYPFKEVAIFLGNTVLSREPDLAIVYTLDSFGEYPGQNVSLIQGLGDINGDEIDDFIVGDPWRAFVDANHIGGTLFVHFGQDIASPEYLSPDAILRPDTSNLDNRQWIFGINEVAVGDFNGDGYKDISSKAFHHSDEGFDEGVGAIHYYFGRDSGLESQPDTTIPIRMEYISGFEVEEVYSRYGGRELLSSIPDLNGDGADELLYVPSNLGQRAVIYEVGSSPNEEVLAILEPENPNVGLHSAGNFVNIQYRTVIGDFTGDGSVNFVAFQRDEIYRDDPLYMYNLSAIPVSNFEDKYGEYPSQFSLSQNYPNPFNPTTNISFNLPKTAYVELDVFNVLGQKVTELVNGELISGVHNVEFDATSFSSGVYFYRLKTDGFSSIKKMLFVK